jgi:hypothetical protein
MRLMLCACMWCALLCWFFEWALHSKQMVQPVDNLIFRFTNFGCTLIYKFVRLQMTRDKFISGKFWVILGHSGSFCLGCSGDFCLQCTVILGQSNFHLIKITTEDSFVIVIIWIFIFVEPELWLQGRNHGSSMWKSAIYTRNNHVGETGWQTDAQDLTSSLVLMREHIETKRNKERQ